MVNTPTSSNPNPQLDLGFRQKGLLAILGTILPLCMGLEVLKKTFLDNQ
jgi:hypothetical protein